MKKKMKPDTYEVVKSAVGAGLKGGALASAVAAKVAVTTTVATTTAFAPATTALGLGTVCTWLGIGTATTASVTALAFSLPIFAACAAGGALICGGTAAVMRHKKNKRINKKIEDAKAAAGK